MNDISFNTNGTRLAVGVSYGWEKGETASKLAENARVSVFVREIGDEVKVRLLHCNLMRDIEVKLFTLIVKSSSQRRRRELGSSGRVVSTDSYPLLIYLLLPVDYTATSALYPTWSNATIDTRISPLSTFAIVDV